EEWRGSRVESLPITTISIHPKLGVAVVVRKNHGEMEDVIDEVNMRCEWMGMVNRRISLGAKIENVAWIGDKAVFACLDGTIKITSPHSTVVESSQVAASPLFGVSPLGESKAVLISHSSLVYYFNVDKMIILKSISLGIDSRLFSLSTLGECVAIGGLDSIWILNGEKEKKEMRLGRDTQRMGTIVWSVAFVREGVLASGDSTGRVSLWNTKTAIRITSILRHEADVLSLCVLNGKIYAAGVDPTIVVIEETSCEVWKDTLTKRVVTRDVRSMSTWGNAVYGGGADEEVFRIGTKPSSLSVLPIHSHNRVKCEGVYALLTNTDHVLLWNTCNGPSLVAKIFSSHHLPITASCISWDGDTIGISTRQSTSLYSFNGSEVSKVRGDLPSSTILISHSSTIFLVSHNVIYRMESIAGEVEEVYRLDSESLITSLSIDDSCSTLCVISSRCSSFRITLPSLSTAPSSVSLSISLPVLSSFSSSSLFILSSYASSADSQCLFCILPSSASPSSSFSSRSFFKSGFISCITSSHLGLLLSSDEESWSILSSSSQVLALPSPKGKSTEREILSLGVHDNVLRVFSTRSLSPSLLPFKTKRFGMQ
ncbi:hypothetical protein PMAYCL1PPCAC_23811, partial [Pristionchus mayeri]